MTPGKFKELAEMIEELADYVADLCYDAGYSSRGRQLHKKLKEFKESLDAPQNRSRGWQIRDHQGHLQTWGLEEYDEFGTEEHCRQAISYYFDVRDRQHSPFYTIYRNGVLFEKVEREPEDV